MPVAMGGMARSWTLNQPQFAAPAIKAPPDLQVSHLILRTTLIMWFHDPKARQETTEKMEVSRFSRPFLAYNCCNPWSSDFPKLDPPKIAHRCRREKDNMPFFSLSIQRTIYLRELSCEKSVDPRCLKTPSEKIQKTILSRIHQFEILGRIVALLEPGLDGKSGRDAELLPAPQSEPCVICPPGPSVF